MDFALIKRQQEVQTLLTSRINHFCASNINPRDRSRSRSAFFEVVWVIPPTRTGEPDFEAAFPVIGKDISARGLSLIHNAPLISDPLVIGLQDQTGPCFVRCSVEHCSSLGYGFYQIGLNPDEVVSVEGKELKALNLRLDHFSPTAVPV